MMSVRLFTTLALGLLILTVPARAFDTTGNAVADGMLAALSNWRDEVVSVGDIDVGDDRVLVRDVEVRARDVDDRYTVDSIEIVNGRMDGDVLVADSVRWGPYEQTTIDAEGGTMTYGFGQVTDTNVRYSPESLAAGGPIGPYFHARAESVAEDVFATFLGIGIVMPRTHTRATPQGDGAMRLEVDLPDVVIKPMVPIDPQTVQTLADASLIPLTGDMRLIASYDEAAKILSLDELRADFTNLGTLTLTFQASGVDDASWLEFVRQVDQDQPLTGEAGRIAIAGFSMQYEDAGGGQTLVAFLAHCLGLRQDVFADVMAAATPGFLGAVEDTDAVEQAADAVRTFLLDPQSIRIEARPDTPVAMVDLEQSAGGSAVSRLNITITAQ
ncbi:MAG: hypothetical protein AAGD34_05850 [Pseudomonadota bacterium]